MKWISEETLKDCQIFRYSKMENGNEGVIPVNVEDLPGIEVGSDWADLAYAICPVDEWDADDWGKKAGEF